MVNMSTAPKDVLPSQTTLNMCFFGLVKNKLKLISVSDDETTIVHESRLGAANPADTERGKSYGIGK
jgi:hypothetical protein